MWNKSWEWFSNLCSIWAFHHGENSCNFFTNKLTNVASKWYNQYNHVVHCSANWKSFWMVVQTVATRKIYYKKSSTDFVHHRYIGVAKKSRLATNTPNLEIVHIKVLEGTKVTRICHYFISCGFALTKHFIPFAIRWFFLRLECQQFQWNIVVQRFLEFCVFFELLWFVVWRCLLMS